MLKRGKAMCDGDCELIAGLRIGQIVTVFRKRMLDREESRFRRFLRTECWKEERAKYDGVWGQVPGGRR